LPRTRQNSGQTVLNQSASYLATHHMQNGSIRRTSHSTVAAKLVRCNSVNSKSSILPHYQIPRPCSISITAPKLQAVSHNSGQTNLHCETESSNTFAVPGEQHLPVLEGGSHQRVLNTCATPLSPLSVSAP
jgi:Tfp pilus assembly protein PilE